MADYINPEPLLDRLDSLDDFFRQQPTGSIEKALSNNLYGLNHRKVKSILRTNKDNYGYTFFTRPQLNLTGGNVRNERKFYNLLTNKELSIFRWARCTLDPRLYYPIATSTRLRETIRTPLVDPQMAFIPVLTNTLKSLSGMPDLVLPNFTSKNGNRKEQWSIPDGVLDVYEALDIDVTFSNIQEEPIIVLFSTWLRYMANVFEGTMLPYMDMITENEIDYNTRIWRLVMGPDNVRVKKIAATGPAWPQNIPMGQFFDYTDERPLSDQAKDVTIRFKCMGVQYNDDILIHEFNETMAIFNPYIRNLIDTGRASGIEKIPKNLMTYFNFRGYPYINPDTYELEWYARSDILRAKGIEKSTDAKKKLLDIFEKED